MFRNQAIHLLYAGSYDSRQEDKPFYRPLHHHPKHVEILLILEGRGSFRIDNHAYTIGPGSLVVYNPGSWHEESAETPILTLFLGFSLMSEEAGPEDSILDPAHPCVRNLTDVQLQRLRNRFRELEDMMMQDGTDPFHRAEHLTALTVAEILTCFYPQGKSNLQALPSHTKYSRRMIRYLEEHYHETFRLDDMARAFHMDKFYVVRRFKRETGYTPNQYVIRCRMSAAKHYLETTSTSMEWISEQVGYSSSTYFQQVFKREEGMTPGEFRRMCKK